MPASSEPTPRAWLLIEDRAGLDSAAQSGATCGLVAGNVHIAAELTRRGIAHVSGGDLQTYDDALAATQAADADLSELAVQLDRLPAPLRAITLAVLAREGLRHHALRRVAGKLDGPFLQMGLTGPEPVSGKRTGTGLVRAAHPLRSDRPVSQRHYVLDFASATGRKGRAGALPCLQPRLSKRAGWQDHILNALAIMATRLRPQQPQALRLHLEAGPIAAPTPIRLASDFAPRAAQIIAETAALFAAAERSMDRILHKHGAPEHASFNHVGDATIAGFQTSLRKAGVPCDMASHGSLAAWGTGPRHRIAAHLSAMYNAFPGMTQLHPRARQLVPAVPDAEIITLNRLRPAAPRPTGPFRIYAAPNFRPWSEGFWGLTNSCFDTLAILEKLAHAVATQAQLEMFLRIKVTAKDIAKPGKRPANRGLFPDDAAHLVDPAAGIYDASLGAHSHYMAQADLVVTEGLTAVMFEALEARCPVLLIVPDPRAAPALPATHVSRLSEPGGRSAVYTANTSDDLAQALVRLDAAHRALPLTDAELAPYLWCTP